MRAGNTNRRVSIGSIFHSKRLNNDEPLGASSRLVSVTIRYGGEATGRAETAARVGDAALICEP